MNTMEDLVSLCKRRGFIFPGSDVYGGMAGTWDFGPLGVALERKIMQAWWDYWVEKRDDIYGVDAAILMNPRTWVASGHVATFADPLVECKNCHGRFRADKLGENISESITTEEFQKLNLKCPTCGKTTRIAHKTDDKGVKHRACKKCGAFMDGEKKVRAKSDKKETKAPVKATKVETDSKEKVTKSAPKKSAPKSTKATGSSAEKMASSTRRKAPVAKSQGK